MTNPTAIARSLSEAQRAAMLWLEARPKWTRRESVFYELQSLDLAIIETGSSYEGPAPRSCRLSPLGKEVRAAIIGEQEKS